MIRGGGKRLPLEPTKGDMIARSDAWYDATWARAHAPRGTTGGKRERGPTSVGATMPRPFPGALSDAEYEAIVAFLSEADANLADGEARLP